MDYAGLIKSEIPPCILIKQFLDSELIAKPKFYPTFTHFIHYLREAIEIAKISLISEEDKEVNEPFLENLQKELEGLENGIYSEDKSLEVCILINQFVERFPTLLYSFIRCSFRFYAKENEEASFEISAVGMHPVTHLSRSGYENWESIQTEIISQTEMKLKSAEFFKESKGTDFMYHLNKLFQKDSIFGYIGRRTISEGVREKERESKAIMILIKEVEKIVEKNKVLVEKFPFREILLTYSRNQHNGGFFLNKGRVDLDNLIHFEHEDFWGIHLGNDKTKLSINLYLEKIGEEANSKNIAAMTLYLLLQIFKNRSFDEDEPMSGIVSFYYEPAILLGHDFQEFGEFIEGIETPFVKFHLQYLDDLFKRSFDIFESNFRSLIGHTYWINQYEEPFYEEVVDIFLALLITSWMILYKPEETEECFHRLTLFFQNFFTFENLDDRFSQYLKALLKYSLINYSKSNKILSDLFVLGIEGDSEDLGEYISKFQKATNFTSRKKILERVVNLDDNGLRSFLYNVIREAEEQLSKFAFTEIIRRNWLPETHEEQIAYNLRTGNWEELCKIEEEQVIQILRNILLEPNEINADTSREEYDEILSISVEKSRIISLLVENNLATDLLIELTEKNSEYSSNSIFSLSKMALNGNSKAIEYLLSINIDSISVESEKATIFALGELAKTGNDKAIDQVLSYCKKKFNEKETRTDRQKFNEKETRTDRQLISSSFRVYTAQSQSREDYRFRYGLVDLLLSIQSDKVKDFLLELARIESPYQDSIIRKLDDLDDQRTRDLLLDIYKGEYDIDLKKDIAKNIGKNEHKLAIELAEELIKNLDFFSKFHEEGRDKKPLKMLVAEIYKDDLSKDDFDLLGSLIKGLAKNESFEAFEYLTSLLIKDDTKVLWKYTHIDYTHHFQGNFDEKQIIHLLHLYDMIDTELKLFVGRAFARINEIEIIPKREEVKKILIELIELAEELSDLNSFLKSLVSLKSFDEQDYSELAILASQVYEKRNVKTSRGLYAQELREMIFDIFKKDDCRLCKHQEECDDFKEMQEKKKRKENDMTKNDSSIVEKASDSEDLIVSDSEDLIEVLLDSEQKEIIREEALKALSQKEGFKHFIGRRTFLTDEDERKLKWRDIRLDDSEKSEEFVKDLKQIIFNEDSEIRLRRIAIHCYAKLFFAYIMTGNRKERNEKRQVLFPLLKHENQEIRAQALYSLIFRVNRKEELEGFEDELISMRVNFVEAIIDQLAHNENHGRYFDFDHEQIQYMHEEGGYEFKVLNYIVAKIAEESEEVKELLMEYIEHSDAKIRLLAFELLAEIEKASEGRSNDFKRLITKMQEDDEVEKSNVLRILSSFEGFWDMDNFLSSLQSEDYSVRTKALTSLEENDEEHILQLLISSYQKENSHKHYIADALGKLGDERAIPHLIKGLEDEKENVRIHSATALSNLKAQEAFEPLINLLEDTNHSVISSTIRALGKLGNHKAVNPIIQKLQDEDKSIRRAAAEVLGILGDKKAIEPLLHVLEIEEDKPIKIQIVSALGNLKASQAIDLLIEAYKDKESAIRMTALAALGKLDDPRIKPILISALNDNITGPIKSAVEALAKEGVETLRTLLEHKKEYVRKLAAEQLGKIKTKTAIDTLNIALRDEDFGVKETAIYALKEIGDKSIVEPLLEILVKEEWYIRRAILDALEDFKDEHIIDIVYNSTIECYKNETDNSAKRSMVHTLKLRYFLEDKGRDFLIEIQKQEKDSELLEIIKEELEELDEAEEK